MPDQPSRNTLPAGPTGRAYTPLQRSWAALVEARRLLEAAERDMVDGAFSSAGVHVAAAGLFGRDALHELACVQDVTDPEPWLGFALEFAHKDHARIVDGAR